MSRADRERLEDMVEVACQLGEIVRRGRAAFDADFTLGLALERCIEIMGEASKAVSQGTKTELPSVPWAELARTRDMISHHYHRVELPLLWRIAVEDVPPIEHSLRAWLEAHPEP